MLDVERPRPRKDEPVKDDAQKYYTVQQLRYILDCLQKEPLKWQTYISLIADTGLRRGEATAIQWKDIDWKESSITIRQNAQYTPHAGIYTTTPKNKKVRRVDIGPDTLNLLRQLRADQAEKAISQFVFTKEGSPDMMHPQSPTRYFKRFGQRYGVDDFHPHKLRHTSASISLANGGDLASVSRRLGHSSAAVTARIYVHANEEGMRRAGQIVRDALKEQGK